MTQHGAIGTYVDRQATTALSSDDTLGSSRPVHWISAQAAFGAKRLSSEDRTLSYFLTQALKDNPRAIGIIRTRFHTRTELKRSDGRSRAAHAVLDAVSHPLTHTVPCPRSVWIEIFSESKQFWLTPVVRSRDTELAMQTLRMCEQLHAWLDSDPRSLVQTLPSASGMDHLQSAIVLARPPRLEWDPVARLAAFELSRSTEHLGPMTVITDELWMGLEVLEHVAATCDSKASAHLDKVISSIAERVLRSAQYNSNNAQRRLKAAATPRGPSSSRVMLRFCATEDEQQTACDIFRRTRDDATAATITRAEQLKAIRVCVSRAANR